MGDRSMQDDDVDTSTTISAISAAGQLQGNVGVQVSQEVHTTVIEDDPTEADAGTIEMNASNLVYTTSSIFDAEAQEQNSKGSKWRTATFASTILAVVGALGLIAVLVVIIHDYLSGQWRPTITDYGIVFDAGSTHTAMMLYGWNGEKSLNGTGTPRQLFKCTVDGDGITSYAKGGEDRLSLAISECLEEGKKRIPFNQVANCPVFFGATAGMRLLNVQDPPTTHGLMDAVVHVLLASGFRFQPSMARILSGIEEGASGWIQTNYLSKSLFGKRSTNSVNGMLDLGGASTQFAAVVPEGLSVDFLPMNLYGVVYNVSVRSYLCFGRRQAQFRHRAMLVLELSIIFDGSIVEDPCLPAGFNMTASVKDIFSSPCTWSDVWNARSSVVNHDNNVTFIGTSSSSLCTAQVRRQLDFTTCRKLYNFKHCFQAYDLTAHNSSFMAISGFYEVMRYLNQADNSQPKYDDVAFSVAAVCNSNLTQIESLYWYLRENDKSVPSSIYPQRMLTICYDATHTFEMLTTGYKFNEVTWEQLTFEDSIDDADMGWAMGYMINKTNWLPSRHEDDNYLPPSAFVYGLLALFAAFLIASVTFAVLRLIRRFRKKTYKKMPPTPSPPHYGAI